MKKIILLSGKANSGKNTFAELCQEYLQSKGYVCIEIAFAGYLKQICKNYLGWDGNKDEKGREILQYVGTDIIRDKLNWQDFHAKRVLEDIKIIEDKFDFILISDARFANECYLTKSAFPNKTTDVLIIRPNFESQLTKEQLNHKSENGLSGYNHEIKIINDGDLEDLRIQAIQYCEQILLEEK